MFERLSKKIVLHEIRHGRIDAEQKEEYTYGMNMFFNVFINILSMIIIGIVTHNLWECVVFCLIYKLLRKYTGGFHFESALHCYISSCIMYFVIIGIIIYIPFKVYEISIIVAVSTIILWGISPIEAIHKPLDEKEKQVFRKRSRINIVIAIIAYVASLFINNKLAYVIGVGIISVMIFSVIGKIKLMLYTERKVE